uniref:Uncharacterized protein n=1 Tax=Romanomermis culicivorax TaxID=13658 RepID=A0A915KP60_ROMCU
MSDDDNVINDLINAPSGSPWFKQLDNEYDVKVDPSDKEALTIPFVQSTATNFPPTEYYNVQRSTTTHKKVEKTTFERWRKSQCNKTHLKS